ncbi:mitochondrial ATP-dependent (S)-NAD(P)H-hydrate dehydratase [Andalucia godoyi]|uniref:ATP-dependent (S)-NAD(P)H-hydrate dehydratase n=1 Tax=Andalucia godoyi TaxID=505711 RepID=A0A8K0AHU9_ANDGO|nr:mitochondrial ATP-dependent (S)-NAD(P)H-hydrate dehydratase [Andalucia godoyi]WCZ58539.1 ATP-dependent (S)-NAD(P)H-hydrate dehydratase [Andalucia godoyi]|eukprot:ANDGO_06963.mRNA.1 mitochondrial ATP-dependent (S)-NAD(P)H-hydrate dehydratase
MRHSTSRIVHGLIPSLNGASHKGQNGRIAVLGGALEYTGAPFFSAISALRMGCDLSYVLCSAEAAVPIKAYSPDLMVIPVGSVDGGSVSDGMAVVRPIIDRLHALVIGPGMGRSQFMLDMAKESILYAKTLSIPIVIDADGLWLINSEFEIVRGYENAILTPNSVEFSRLAKAVLPKYDAEDKASSSAQTVSEVAVKLGSVCIVRKGTEDCCSNGNETIVNTMEGIPRRVGGQGDVLSGCIAACAAWASIRSAGSPHSENPALQLHPMIQAAYAGTVFSRLAFRKGFEARGRSMLVSDALPFVGTLDGLEDV